MLRGIAACSVVFIHTYYQVGHGTMHFGGLGAGVDLFFVISGFIMARVSQGRTPAGFLFDRFWRIYPLWWIAELPWLWVKRRWLTWPILASSLTLWPFYGRIAPPALTVGWTLCFEMLFYLAMALSLRAGSKVPLALFVMFLTGGILTDTPIFDFLGSPMIFEFLFGVAIAQIPGREKFALPILGVALLLLALSPDIDGGGMVAGADAAWIRVICWGIPCALLFYSALSLESSFKSPTWNVPVLLGDASYSIYLFHLPIVHQVHAAWPAVFVMAVAAGIMAWWAIERGIIAKKSILLGYAQLVKLKVKVKANAP